MPFLATCLLAASCAAGSATFVTDDAVLSAQTSSSSSSSSLSHRSGAQPHHLGIGATFGLSQRGGGVTIRYFFLRQIGVDTRVLFTSRPNDTGSSQGMSIQVMPSLIVMLTKPNPSSDVDIRPYAGVGFGVTHARPDVQLGFPSQTATGEVVYGGVEIQFRQGQSFALSAEVDYFHQPSSLAGTTAPSGTIFLIAVHFYR